MAWDQISNLRGPKGDPGLGGVAPSHAGTRSNLYDSGSSVYNLTATTGRRLRAGLSKARSGELTRVHVIGDSLSAGVGATPGSTDCYRSLGRLLRAAGYPVGDVVHLVNLAGGDPRVSSGGIDNSGGFVSFPWFAGSGGGSLTFTSDTPGTVLEVITSGESGQIAYSIDGGAVTGTITPSGAPGVETYTVTGLFNTTHTVTLTAIGNVYVAGVGIRPAEGIVIRNGGMSGSTADNWRNSDPALYGSLPVVLHGNPDVVIIELMMNDFWAGRTAAQFEGDLRSLTQTAWATGAAVLLVASQRPDDASTAYDAFLSAAYDVADTEGVPLLDLADLFGPITTYGASGLDLSDADDVHLNPRGYTVKAAALTELLAPGSRPTMSALADLFTLGTGASTGNLALGDAAPVDWSKLTVGGMLWVIGQVYADSMDTGNPASLTRKDYVDNGLAGKVDTSDSRLTDARTPTAHTHVQSDVTGLSTALAGKASTTHSHVTGDVTGLDTALSGKAAASHSHAIGDLPVATSGTSNTTQLVRADDSRLSNARTPTAHTHATSEVTGLDTALAGKAASSHSHAIGDLPVATSGTSSTTQIVRADDSRLSNARTPTAHTHAISDTTGLQAALDGKQAAGSYAAASHVHAAGDVTSGKFGSARMPAVLSTVRTASISGGTLSIDASVDGNNVDVTVGSNFTQNVPTNGTAGQVIQVTCFASAAYVVTFHASFARLTGIANTLSIPSGKFARYSLRATAASGSLVWIVEAVGVTQ